MDSNKFSEYNIPILVINSSVAPFVILVVGLGVILAAKVVSLVRNHQTLREKEGSPFLQLVLVLLGLVIPNLLFYSLVGLWWNSHEGNVEWGAVVFSTILALFVFTGLILALIVGWGGYGLFLEKKARVVDEISEGKATSKAGEVVVTKKFLFEVWNI